MPQITMIGLDIAKRWFQARAVDADWREVFNKKLSRNKLLSFLAAIPQCEAASRPDMRFVRVKSAEEQAALVQHTSWQLLIDQRTAVSNSLRSQLAEFGVIASKGEESIETLMRMVDEGDEALCSVPPIADGSGRSASRTP